jgi:hypothetical protein
MYNKEDDRRRSLGASGKILPAKHHKSFESFQQRCNANESLNKLLKRKISKDKVVHG